MNNMSDNSNNWFYIKHLSTDKVVASCTSCNSQQEDCARSQVAVIKPRYTDDELWCWDDHCLKNKSTGLVLDIRKGRLRLIEDTEICLFYKKPSEESHNQLWAIRPAGHGTEESNTTEHPLYKSSIRQSSLGNVIYSICNSDWVLDICCPEDDSTDEQRKLILLPQHQHESPNQRWEFIAEYDILNNDLSAEPSLIFDDNSLESSMIEDNYSYVVSPASSISCESIGFAHGLTPAKRGSQTSLTAVNRKESLEDLYLYQTHQHHPFYH